jgi:hypothetical protein
MAMDAPSQQAVAFIGDELIMRPGESREKGAWRPVLTLLLLSPVVGELLSGSSPPALFFNPIALLLMVGLYGCGALLVRELAVCFRLNVLGLLLLGAAYGIVEEGLMCKSFFNPFWKDVGFLSTYGRALGVNWLWAIGLTYYHAIVSITVPIFLTEAMFAGRATRPWLRTRGRVIAGVCLGLVTLLGFVAFDSPEFHRLDLKDPVALASRLRHPQDPLTQFIADRLDATTRDALSAQDPNTGLTPKVLQAVVNALNRVLPDPDLYSQERFASVPLPDDLRAAVSPLPRGDKRVRLNRALLEAAYAQELSRRPTYPYRPPWPLTLGCVLAVAGLAALANRQRDQGHRFAASGHPWLQGLITMLVFALLGFVLPSLVENGTGVPAVVTAALWFALAAFVGRQLRRLDGPPGRVWRRGLWALGVLTPWSFFAILLGLIVQVQGAKSFAGMPVVALVFGAGILVLASRWRRRLALESMEPVAGSGGPGPETPAAS